MKAIREFDILTGEVCGVQGVTDNILLYDVHMNCVESQITDFSSQACHRYSWTRGNI